MNMDTKTAIVQQQMASRFVYDSNEETEKRVLLDYIEKPLHKWFTIINPITEVILMPLFLAAATHFMHPL